MVDETFKNKVTQLFRAAFPEGYVDVSEGYHDRLHVLVISRDFDGLTEREKQTRLWEIARRELAEKTTEISLLIGYSPDELK
ncbi:hypothetical protein HYR99_41295 [Candidatus Poribacteria bacterium]|nr:hypothetical protein [Candidatus Poribacteria bacterium]